MSAQYEIVDGVLEVLFRRGKRPETTYAEKRPSKIRFC